MSISEVLRERAACIRAQARYEHELDYCAGLEAAADAIDNSIHAGNAVTALLVKENNPEKRRGLKKAISMIEGLPEWTTAEWMARIDQRLSALEAQIAGLALGLSRKGED